MQTTTATGWLAVLLATAGTLAAHHALASFDTTKAVRIKGTIVRFYAINPHTILMIEAKDAEGQVRRWAAEGPALTQLNRRNFNQATLKPGATIEVCGYLPKETIVWQMAAGENTTSLSGRLINAESMVMPDGKEQGWGDYGIHKCFEPGYADGHRAQ